MRTIKFRGVDMYTNKWIYGYLSWKEPFETSVLFINNRIVHKESVSQFTGLYDKNGNEIYEGDILYNEPIHKKTAKYKTPIKNFIVCFEVCGFECKSTVGEKTALLRYNTKCFEVIGNIHDNPELLK